MEGLDCSCKAARRHHRWARGEDALAVVRRGNSRTADRDQQRGNSTVSRATARNHELGIRTALGAARGRIIRQLLTESLVLSRVGGALGIALAYAAVQFSVRLNPGNIPRFDSASVDGRVLLVAVAIPSLRALCRYCAGHFRFRVSVNDC